MAKGIITQPPTGGGKLVISDFDPVVRVSYKPGTEIDYISDKPVDIGYLVKGTVAPNQDGKLIFTVSDILDSAPIVVTGSNSGINLGVDKACIVTSSGQIAGSVAVNGGVLIVKGGKATGNVSIGANSTIICTTGSTIGGGDVDVIGSGVGASIAFQGCTVNGKFSTNGIEFLDLGGNNFNGNVTSTANSYVTIKNNSVNNNKNLTVSQVVVECSISGNTVTGTTTLDPKCQA